MSLLPRKIRAAPNLAEALRARGLGKPVYQLQTKASPIQPTARTFENMTCAELVSQAGKVLEIIVPKAVDINHIVGEIAASA